MGVIEYFPLTTFSWLDCWSDSCWVEKYYGLANDKGLVERNRDKQLIIWSDSNNTVQEPQPLSLDHSLFDVVEIRLSCSSSWLIPPSKINRLCGDSTIRQTCEAGSQGYVRLAHKCVSPNIAPKYYSAGFVARWIDHGSQFDRRNRQIFPVFAWSRS